MGIRINKEKLLAIGLEEVRSIRNELLSKTDFSALPDVDLNPEETKAYKKYRKELRDITKNITNPDDLVDLEWPTLNLEDKSSNS